MSTHPLLFLLLDLAGTFVFALSGASAAKEKGFDLFGIIAVAFVVACGGGVVRDLCLGAVPPASFSNWRYLLVTIIASGLSIFSYPWIQRMRHPVLWFDAVGLGLFSVTGAHKALLYGSSAEAAVILGTLTAVGGGIIRDVLLARAPSVFQKEIYALAAIIGALIQVSFESAGMEADWTAWLAMLCCLTLRLVSLHYHWHLPTFAAKRGKRRPGK